MSKCINGFKRNFCGDKECNSCFNNSLASLDNIKEKWSRKNNVEPYNVCLSSKEYYFYICKCGHESERKGDGFYRDKCKYCSNGICFDENCEKCFDRSFASHPRSKYWSSKNKLTPRQVAKHTPRKQFFFSCPDCEHEYLAYIHSKRATETGCPFCTTRRICEDRSCLFCFSISFQSHLRAKFWNTEENESNPRDHLLGAIYKANFICENNHKFKLPIFRVTQAGMWCDQCSKKSEKKLYYLLLTYFPEAESGFFADWCRNPETGKYLPFDIVIEKYKIIIEVDGEQHFIFLRNWGDPEKTQERDIFKMEKALDNGYTVIRILELEMYKRNYYLEDLLNYIKEYQEATIIFIDVNNKYQGMIEKLLKEDNYYLS